jgi:hypothetical protein
MVACRDALSHLEVSGDMHIIISVSESFRTDFLPDVVCLRDGADLGADDGRCICRLVRRVFATRIELNERA